MAEQKDFTDNFQELKDFLDSLPDTNTSGLSTYPFPPPNQSVCPGCGRCNTCGRQGSLPVQPYWETFRVTC